IGFAAVTTAAYVFARLAQRVRQPAVMGEIVAGIALGPSLLGLLPGDLTERLFPTDVRPYLNVIAQLGLTLFMFGVGHQLDLTQLRGAGRRIVSISLGSMLLPFGLGVGAAVVLYSWMDQSQLRGDGMLGPVLFMGVATSITAFPVLARIIHERGMNRDPVGAMSLASAAVQDALAWCVLAAVVVAASSGGSWPMVRVFVQSAGFVLVLMFVVRPLLVRLLASRGDWCRGTPAALAVLVPSPTPAPPPPCG
ncbi:cation:proton antiporter, partial [Streptomyces sp. NPDC059142]|uniref:cation:proton antiporter n=1 Tax=Streptomyces sp. NPDC059142 TaxID=3346739 RepID=UPI00367FBAB8